MTYDFITIGGTTRDISFFTDQGVLLDNKQDVLRQKILAFESGAKIKVDQFFYSFGGGAANAAVCLANFGLKTACLAPIGDDENGRLIIKNLKNRQVDTKLIKKIKNIESGSSFILVSPSGERIIFAQRGANRYLNLTSKELKLVKNTKNIYLASLSGNWQANLRQIFLSVKKDGPKIFWNPGATQLAGGIDLLTEFMDKVEVLALNKDEAIELIVRSKGYAHLKSAYLNKTENLLKIIYSFGPKVVVITLGAAGVMAYDGRKIYQRQILKEKKRIDSTGIGDIFNATFAAGYSLYQANINKALDLSLKNASAKISHQGAQNGLIKK